MNETITLDNIQQQKRLLQVQEELLLQQNLSSQTPEDILKAMTYIEEVRKNKTKSFLYAPEHEFLGMNGWRVPMKAVSHITLRNMARTPVIRTIVGTRCDQVAAYAEPSDREQEKGWKIRVNKWGGREDKNTINQITKSIMEGGFNTNRYEFDSFEAILRQITRDSLELDQLCMEIIGTKGGQPLQFVPVDAATIKITDPESSKEPLPVDRYGMQAKYVQEWRQKIYTYFFPYEMTFGIRNKSSDIYTNGYGISELEDLIQIVTGLLNAVQWNLNFFSQGSNPKGFFAIKGSLGSGTVADFRQMWRNTISGLENSHKVPVIESEGGDIQWVDMMKTNIDMEHSQFLEFLIVMACCVFKIDPSECGWNFGKLANSIPFGQDGQKQRLKHSQSKGLVPVMKLIQRIITKYWVNRIDDNYEFVFTGLEPDDKAAELEMDAKKIEAGLMSLEDGFEKHNYRKFNPDKDTILNPVYLQMKQQQMMEQQAMMEQPEEVNPFEKAMINYLDDKYLEK